MILFLLEQPELDLDLNSWGIPLGYPTFNPEYLDTRFRQLELRFQLSGIAKQGMMFRHAIVTLSCNVTSLVFDTIGDAPEDLCYDLIKKSSEIEDHSPSQLLRHMCSLTSGCGLNDKILKELWVNMAPSIITSFFQDDLGEAIKNFSLLWYNLAATGRHHRTAKENKIARTSHLLLWRQTTPYVSKETPQSIKTP
nr:gag pol polyprotein [Hymenolepis microstoma]